MTPVDSAHRVRRTRTLTRRIVVAAAVAIAGRDGLDAVTMRRVAADLGVSAMGLYRHVTDREDLLVGMLDALAHGIEWPEPVDDPRAEITALFTAIHDALRRESWAVPLLADGLAGPSILPALERIFAALDAAGFGPRDAFVGYALLWQYCLGELLSTHRAPEDSSFAQRMVRTADPAAYPVLRSMTDAQPQRAHGDHFAENFQRLLDGLMR